MSNTVNSEGNVQHGQVDETPLSPVEEMKSPLEKLLKQRPNEKELIEKNIMHDSKVAPALQAAQKELERSQLQDKLGQALHTRPTPQELVKEGILEKTEAPDSSLPAEKVEVPSIS